MVVGNLSTVRKTYSNKTKNKLGIEKFSVFTVSTDVYTMRSMDLRLLQWNVSYAGYSHKIKSCLLTHINAAQCSHCTFHVIIFIYYPTICRSIDNFTLKMNIYTNHYLHGIRSQNSLDIFRIYFHFKQ